MDEDKNMRYAITVNEVKGSNNGLKGFASITFGDSFKITNVAIMQNQDTGEFFVSMPRYKTNEKDENEKEKSEVERNEELESEEQMKGQALQVLTILRKMKRM